MSWDSQIDAMTIWLNGWLAEDVESVGLSLGGRGMNLFATWPQAEFSSVGSLDVERALEGLDTEPPTIKGVVRLKDHDRSTKQKTWNRPPDLDDDKAQVHEGGPLTTAVAEAIRHFKTVDQRKDQRIEYLEGQVEQRVTDFVAARIAFMTEALDEAQEWKAERNHSFKAGLELALPRLAHVLDKAIERWDKNEETIEIVDEEGNVVRKEVHRRS